MEPVCPIGVFDSGYGGLTVFRSIKDLMPGYDYVYLGDNARAPYGNRSFETVYHYTLQCLEWFFRNGSPLIILACNTASAKALRTIQQNDLPRYGGDKRVLGVIRPTAETIGQVTQTKTVGILGTKGTITSGSYELEISKLFPDLSVVTHACPMWVPLVENGEHNSEGADYFVKKDLDAILAKSDKLDTLLLACTHYPLLYQKIRKYLPEHIRILTQGTLVAESLKAYLEKHPEIEQKITRTGQVKFYTTDDTTDFDQHAAAFFGKEIRSMTACIG